MTSGQTRKGETGPLGKTSGAGRHYRGKERAPRGFLGALVGASMSIARKGRKEEEQSEKET